MKTKFFARAKKSNFLFCFRYAQVMSSLLNDQFGYLIASIEREVDPPGAMPHSLSFDNVKDLYGQKFAVHLMESKPDENNVKDNTFFLSADKVTFPIPLNFHFSCRSSRHFSSRMDPALKIDCLCGNSVGTNPKLDGIKMSSTSTCSNILISSVAIGRNFEFCSR